MGLILGLGVPLDMLLSVVVLVGWFVVMLISTGDLPGTLIGTAFLLLPCCLIWFRDPISELTGFGLHQLNVESPPGLVAYFGWLGLIAMIWMEAAEAFQ